MRPERIMIWRFSAAPKALRSLHPASKPPEWLAFIPRVLSGPDLDQAISAGTEPGQLARYETPKGDVVYVGNTPMDRSLQSLARSIQPAVAATAAARRK